jgi:hypothetical protein
MAHWAEVDKNNIVTRVTVMENSLPNQGLDWLVGHFGGVWLKTSYNTRSGVYVAPNSSPPEPDVDQTQAFRVNYAGIGYTYDEARDAFVAPQPYPSWTLKEATCQWDAPVPYPADEADYAWDEETINWEEVQHET